MNSHSIQPIVIEYVVGDELTHFAPYYFCSVPDCPCHQDMELKAALQQAVDAGDLTPRMGILIFWNLEHQEGDTH